METIPAIVGTLVPQTVAITSIGTDGFIESLDFLELEPGQTLGTMMALLDPFQQDRSLDSILGRMAEAEVGAAMGKWDDMLLLCVLREQADALFDSLRE